MMKTQVMKTRNPKLFYLVREVLGFLFLFVFTGYSAQVVLVGDVVVVINNVNQIKDSAVHITSGTYIYNFEKTEKSPAAKIINKINRNTIKNKLPEKLLAAKKQSLKTYYQKQYSSADSKKSFSSASVLKTVFITNNDHHNTQSALAVNWYSTGYIFPSFSKILTKSAEGKQDYFHHQLRIRPPPNFRGHVRHK